MRRATNPTVAVEMIANRRSKSHVLLGFFRLL